MHRDGKDLPADMLTKALPLLLFAKHRDYVMGGQKAQRHFETKRIRGVALLARVVDGFKPSAILVQDSQSARGNTSPSEHTDTIRTFTAVTEDGVLLNDCGPSANTDDPDISIERKSPYLMNTNCDVSVFEQTRDWNCGSSATCFCRTTGNNYLCANRKQQPFGEKVLHTMVNTNPVATFKSLLSSVTVLITLYELIAEPRTLLVKPRMTRMIDCTTLELRL